MVSLSRKTLRAAQVALQRCPTLRTGKRRIIIPWIEKSSIAQFAPERLLSDSRTGCSISTGQAAPRHWNNRASLRNTKIAREFLLFSTLPLALIRCRRRQVPRSSDRQSWSCGTIMEGSTPPFLPLIFVFQAKPVAQH